MSFVWQAGRFVAFAIIQYTRTIKVWDCSGTTSMALQSRLLELASKVETWESTPDCWRRRKGDAGWTI